jgi:hypothetical protein
MDGRNRLYLGGNLKALRDYVAERRPYLSRPAVQVETLASTRDNILVRKGEVRSGAIYPALR